MQATNKILTAVFAVCGFATIMAFTHQPKKTDPPAQGKIQVAILLDVSNSMDGLIEQAKAQLWNMVSVMGKAKCANDLPPEIEIALYEYGRSSNDKVKGYVKQISGFTTDLDLVSKNLFALNTNGGDEYCGHVIWSSIDELKWDPTPGNYKVIFIAGNEDFLQGDVSYSKSCSAAKQKGVILNTIYCGDRMQGIREHWNLGSECGTGSYTNINQDAKVEDIPTPYDSTLFVLNDKLNGTYIAYGASGGSGWANQAAQDKANYSMNKSVAAKRVAVKGKKELYKNDSWDLVDAQEKDAKFINNIKKEALPDSLKNKSKEEIAQIVKQKGVERGNIQQEIAKLSVQRENYIAEERKKNATNKNAATLETEVERIIREQAKRYNMSIQ